jgi:hypothetical protein
MTATEKPKKEPDYIPVRNDQPFFTLRQAWILKGALYPSESFCRYPYIQPLGGLYNGFVGGKGVFTNETVMEWLTLLDEDMEAYNRKYKTGAKARAMIKKGRLKRYIE